MRHSRVFAFVVGVSAGWFAVRLGRKDEAAPPVPEAPAVPGTRSSLRRPVAFALLALGFGVPAFLLLPRSADRPPATPTSKITVMVDRPGLTGSVVLNLASAEPDRPVRASLDLWFALPAGRTVRWLVATDPAWPIVGTADRTRGVLATGTFVGRGARSPLRGDPPDARSAEGAGVVASIPLTLPAGEFAVRGSRVSLVPPRVDIGDRRSDGSVIAETTSALLPRGTWYSPAGTAGVVAPIALNRYRAEVVSPAAPSPGWWKARDRLTVSWLGTDTSAEAAGEKHLFLAGVLFGLAGGSAVAALQEIHVRRRAYG